MSAKRKPSRPSQAQTVSIPDLPLASPPDDPAHTYLPRHVEIGGLPVEVRLFIWRLREGLRQSGATVLGTKQKPVHQNVDAVRYLLEAGARAMENGESMNDD